MMGGKSEKERKNKPKTTNLQSLLQIKEEKGKKKKKTVSRLSGEWSEHQCLDNKYIGFYTHNSSWEEKN